MKNNPCSLAVRSLCDKVLLMQDLTFFLTNHALLTAAACAVVILLAIIEFLRLKRQTFNVSVNQAIQLINRENAVIIDLRPQDAYRKSHILDAISIPAADIRDKKKIDKYKTKTLLLVCQNGVESQKIAAFLLKAGYNAYSLSGGIRAWAEANMPLAKE